MSERMTVGFVKGMRAIPQYDFTPEEKERVRKAKEKFDPLFNQEMKKKLEENGLEDLRGWMVLSRFHSDGFTRTASFYLYTYWEQEERQNVFSVPFESFVDTAQSAEIAQKVAEKVTQELLKKADYAQKLLANPK